MVPRQKDAQAVEALRAAALIGREFPLDVVAALVDDGDRSAALAAWSRAVELAPLRLRYRWRRMRARYAAG